MWQSKNPKWVKGTRDSFASEPVIHSYRISNTLAINQVYKVPTSLWCQRVVTQTNNSCAMYKNCSENALIWVHFLFSAALLKSGQTWTLIQIYIFFLIKHSQHVQPSVQYCRSALFSFTVQMCLLLTFTSVSAGQPELFSSCAALPVCGHVCSGFESFILPTFAILPLYFEFGFVIHHGWWKLMRSERRRLRSRPKKKC